MIISRAEAIVIINEPTITSVTPDTDHPGERVDLIFTAGAVTYDDVRMKLYLASSGNLVRGKDVCEPVTSATFVSGQSYTCIVHNLRPNTGYIASLQGFVAANLNANSDGLTTSSANFTFQTGSSFNLECGGDFYTIDFLYDDVISHNPQVRIAEAFTYSGNDTEHFDAQNGVQSIYAGNTPNFVIDQDEVIVFRGFPASISIDSNDSHITNIVSTYDFHVTDWHHGDNTTYQLNVTDFSGQRITGILGEVNAEGELTGLQFISVDDNGNVYDTGCIGPAENCTTFNVTQLLDDEYMVTISGEFNRNTSSFLALSFGWVSLDLHDYALSGNSSCVLNKTINWQLIEDSSFGITVSPPSECGSVRSIDDVTKQINYTNNIDLSDDNSTSAPIAGVGISIVRPQGGINVRCTYNTSGVVDSNFSVIGEDEQYVRGTNEIPFQLRFYADSGYTTPYAVGTLLNVLMSDRFYFAAEFKYNNPEHLGGMVIYAPECYATQGSSPDKSSGYLYMEKNGCKMQNDPVFQRDHALRAEHNNTLDPLSYTAFGWQGQTSSVVYVHCIVTACLNILDSNCVAPS
ncbi:uncharacterized protein LOC142344881 [Convolutriloba macropyga]|uniref:uncharacterized protein LOC142344881 n=1 Tax=Convolutriloba macropyga TaxID=536237 RepID=UPI003F523566